MASFYDYSVQDRKGNEVKMADFAGKVVLVVNTATGCGFTPHSAPCTTTRSSRRCTNPT